MARWEPNARDRLRLAAFALYRERGFEHTTVAEIAERAGLTERTFFRHFADKREVLFAGSEGFQQALVNGAADAPPSVAPLDAVAAGLAAAAAQLPDRQTARQRAGIIAANPELQERELIKFASMSAGLADTLRERGVPAPAASLTAEAGVAVFKVAFERWVNQEGELALPELIAESLRELRALAA